jgi:hypothetical protein
VVLKYNSKIYTNFPSIKKSNRSAHIYNYIRREIALDLKILALELKFYYECIEWF